VATLNSNEMDTAAEPPRIAGPVAQPKTPHTMPLPGAWDAHAHIFGPSDKFPYTAGRGYTPPDAPVESYVALLDRLGLARGLIVQGNAHGFDNRVLLDALARYPQRFRGVAITDTRIKPETLHDWHRLGMRGLRFHLFSDAGKPGYVRGVGLDVFEVFRKTMRDLGWVMQVFCDWRLMRDVAPVLREISREMPVIVDHMLNIPAERGVSDENFQALLRFVGEGHAHVKLSAAYRLSMQFPNYPDARPFHDALVRANPERLMWGTDWPHPSIPGDIMPDDGHLLDLFHDWTPDEATRRRILVETPQRLFEL
jgi:predicted TIM-barrel fold metal-dependent hydrolase